ncbi:MAG: DUF2207 domain-containing protein [Bacilli bacterium]|nr:DUF2207 domain-containing protein [Bacilli bacterium]
MVIIVFLFTLFMMLINVLPLILIAWFIGSSNLFGSKNKYGYINNKKILYEKVPIYTEIPCNKDIYYANVLLKLNNFPNYKETNIFGAIILKWLKEEKIVINNESKSGFNIETSIIDLTKNPEFDSTLEGNLFNLLYEVSNDGLLEPIELENICKYNYERFLQIFKDMNFEKISELKMNNNIHDKTPEDHCRMGNVMDDIIYKDSIELYGLKKYLTNFTDMANKEVKDVQLWDEYLMFAYLFGIADKVSSQFKLVDPEIKETTEYYDLDTSFLSFIDKLTNYILTNIFK